MDEVTKQLIVRISLENLALQKENKVLEKRRTDYVNKPPKRHEKYSLGQGPNYSGTTIELSGLSLSAINITLPTYTISNGFSTTNSLIITHQGKTLNGFSNTTTNC